LLQAVDLFGLLSLKAFASYTKIMKYICIMTASSRRWIHSKNPEQSDLCMQVLRNPSLPAGTGLADTDLPMVPSPLS
jgi:hypothetical protein